jgi:hypothetical protein
MHIPVDIQVAAIIIANKAVSLRPNHPRARNPSFMDLRIAFKLPKSGSYTNDHIIPATTSEIAVGRKIIDLRRFLTLISNSRSRAIPRPKRTGRRVNITSHITLFFAALMKRRSEISS